ncbi:MAG: hypothetical protein P8M04_07870 [Akkermansiaceae bacterium]|nr:hypothetical protein [Akkermansiaceae bacterium]
MKPDPSNPFTAAQSDSSGPLENPFEQAPKQPETPLPFQQKGTLEKSPSQLPERRIQKEVPLSPSSPDAGSVPKQAGLPPIRLSEPMEGFAIPGRPVDPPKPVRETPKMEEQDPLVMPAPFEQSALKRLAESDIPLSSDPVPDPQSIDERQLVLRAIFGVAHNLNRDEILKRASALSGIVSVQLLGRAEQAAFSVLRGGIRGLGHGADLNVVSEEASVELIHGEATTLVVFYKGEFRPGVREILTIVAREFSQID